jgi:transcriptional regulator with XRE-family HTH domain
MNAEVKKEMGRRLTEQRLKMRYKQKDLSAFLGCHYASVSIWESGRQQIPLKYFIRIPILLKCKLEDLLPSEDFLCQHK